MISELFTEETVAVDIVAKDWEEAVRYGGKLLVDAGKTQDMYTEAMVNNVKKMGEYIVIAPGLAMPHARPEFGVKALGMGLVKLKEAVHFGNAEYDPVDILVFLCAVDQTAHITALAELMQLIEDEDFLTKVRNDLPKEEILNYINKNFK
jgi:PTS system ascorbate-specific IIA component